MKRAFIIYNSCPTEFDDKGPVEDTAYIFKRRANGRLAQLKAADPYATQYYELKPLKLDWRQT